MIGIENVITILGVVIGAVSMFFALKTQVDKITIVVENNTKEIHSMRKFIESITTHNDSEHEILKNRLEDTSKNIQSHGIRIYEIERTIGIRT